MIVMYLRTPISAISSVWRSQSVGFIDPFFTVGVSFLVNQQRHPGLKSGNKIRFDIWEDSPCSKKTAGTNGVELKPTEYNYMVERSGIDVPKLEYASPKSSMDYENEKEVEEKLVKPLLKRLGYSDTDYVQQMYIEIGNHNHALIPDFVLKPISSSGHYSGFTILEARRSIITQKQSEDTKTQTRSCAKLLGTRYAVIVSMENCFMAVFLVIYI